MSRKFGFRIGDIGLEFISKEDRDKAIKTFTQGCDVRISNSGIKYSDGKGTFSVYDRDTKETITTCCVCKGEFDISTCPEREYPYKNSWQKNYDTTTGYICDACLAKNTKAKEVFDAKRLLEEKEE